MSVLEDWMDIEKTKKQGLVFRDDESSSFFFPPTPRFLFHSSFR